ncbi:MAG: IS1-like element transposase [Candidatus Competibacteraceae bacterium]
MRTARPAAGRIVPFPVNFQQGVGTVTSIENANLSLKWESSSRKLRDTTRNDSCGKTFIQAYSDKGRLPEIKQRIVEMAVNGSGIRDTARVLGVSTDTVINELKKKSRNCKRLTLLF